MTEIRFYHLQTQSLENALPEILEKALEREFKIIIKASTKEEVKLIDKFLWTSKSNDFIPHGYKKNRHETDQPIWITTKDENLNNANMLVLINEASSDNIDDMDLCCKIFDSNNTTALEQSRSSWKEFKDKDYELTYWQQDKNGKWSKRI